MSSPTVGTSTSYYSSSTFTAQNGRLPVGARSRSSSSSSEPVTPMNSSPTKPSLPATPKINPKAAFAHPSTFAPTGSNQGISSPPSTSLLSSLPSATSVNQNLSSVTGSRPPSTSHAAGILPPASFFKSIPRRNSAAGGPGGGRPSSNSASPSAASTTWKPSLVATVLPIGRVVPLPLDPKSSTPIRTLPTINAVSDFSQGSSSPAPDASAGGGGAISAPATPTSPTIISEGGRQPWTTGPTSSGSVVRHKQSREFLLPIGEKSSQIHKSISEVKSTTISTGRGSLERAWRRGIGQDDLLLGRGSMDRERDDSGLGFTSMVRSELEDSTRRRDSVTIEMGYLSNILPDTLTHQAENSQRDSLSKVQPPAEDPEAGSTNGGLNHGQGASNRRDSKQESDVDEDDDIRVDLSIHRSSVEQRPRRGTGRPSSPPSRHAHFGPLPHSRPTSASRTSSHPHGREHVMKPPYMVPILSGKTSKPIRNHSLLPSKNKWAFRGHILFGGDSPLPFLGAVVIVLAIAGIWFSTTCVWWWRRGQGGAAIAGVGAYMCLLTTLSMFMTACRDPGILPRDLDPDPPYPPTTSDTSESHSPVPLPRDLRVRSGTVRVKYCITCKTYRPPRSSHCKMCDNCVDGCDHHCQWVNNCIGRRNYTYFITFVVTASLTTMLVLVTAILHLYFLTTEESFDFKGALGHAPGSAVAVGLCGVVLWPLSVLTGYHIRLLLLNITTIEQVRNQAHKKLTNQPLPPNPFSLGKWQYNLSYLLFRPAGFSWVDPSAIALQDTRKINPGFVVLHGGDGMYESGDSSRRESEKRASSVDAERA